MKVCDRHKDRPATETVHIKRDDVYIDFCKECKTDFLTWAYAPGVLQAIPDAALKRRGRPPKSENLTQ